MSFDVFVQRFLGRDGADLDEQVVRQALERHVLRVEPEHNFVHVTVGDGEMDLYGWATLQRGFMVNHVSGTDPWQLLVDIARTAQLTVIPVGCPVAVTSTDALDHLPDELRTDAIVVATGAQLLHAIQHS